MAVSYKKLWKLLIDKDMKKKSVAVHEGIEFFDSYQREHKGDEK